MKVNYVILSASFAKRIMLTVCMMIVGGTMYAQQEATGQLQPETTEAVKKPQWGVKAALNIASLSFNADNGGSEESKSVIGGAAGLTFTYAFNPQWRLHSGIELNMKGFAVNVQYSSRKMTVHAGYIQIPVQCGYAINFGNWNLEPRLGAYFAYGILGNYGMSGSSVSKKTFGDEVLTPFDAGIIFGFYVDNGKYVFGIGNEIGLTEANGDHFTVSGGSVHTRNTFFTLGYLF
ncbi:MAG: porin family protein [Prevotella sp.]|nr:porin family protein [Prevotella sp.]